MHTAVHAHNRYTLVDQKSKWLMLSASIFAVLFLQVPRHHTNVNICLMNIFF